MGRRNEGVDMRFAAYINENDITYDQYVQGVNFYFSIDEGLNDFKDRAVDFIKKRLKGASDEFDRISNDFGLSLIQIAHALAEKDMYKLMKSFGFSFAMVMKTLHDLTGIVRKGLFEVFEELHDTTIWQKFKAGTVKWDEVVAKYPILKSVTGPMVAGLLFFMWTQMTFIGNLDYDFDFSTIAAALKGNYSLEDVLGGPQGLMLVALFASGSLISVPWLGKTTYNLILALTYTGIKKVAGSDHKVVQKIKSKVVMA